MSDKEIRISFQPLGRQVYVLPGTLLLEAAAQAGLIIATPCGGAATCGKCLVRVTDGDCPASEHEGQALTAEQVEEGYRLACQCHPTENMTVEIPDTSLFQSGNQILSHTAERQGDVKIDASHKLDPSFGIAVDLGTTTVVGTLIDRSTGKDVALCGRMNPQTSFGDDIVSRVKRCVDEADGLAELNEAIITVLNEIIGVLCEDAGIARSEVVEMAIAGNTAMQQILCRIDPIALASIPFTPAFTDPIFTPASELGLSIAPDGMVFVFPQIGGFVGGDTVAGIIATRLPEYEGPSLFIDVGTNGELVLSHDGKLTATSVAAGPAFEGARILHGMRAANGAIEKVVISEDVHLNVIGNVKPTGLCGTALIDAVAGLLRCGIVDTMGRILERDELPTSIPQALRDRIVASDYHADFELARKEECGADHAIRLHQRDIRELQLANGAIRAGIRILLKQHKLRPKDLEVVLVAGAFGNFIRRNNALRIGMLPPIPADRIRFVGNTASFGAKRALLSEEEKVYAAQIRDETEHIDLSSDPDFQDEFGAAMIFPEA